LNKTQQEMFDTTRLLLMGQLRELGATVIDLITIQGGNAPAAIPQGLMMVGWKGNNYLLQFQLAGTKTDPSVNVLRENWNGRTIAICTGLTDACRSMGIKLTATAVRTTEAETEGATTAAATPNGGRATTKTAKTSGTKTTSRQQPSAKLARLPRGT
jgi:hypothetical protein